MKTDREFLARRLPDFSLVIFFLASTLGAFTGGIWASFGIGGALIMFACMWRIERRAPQFDKPLVIFAFAVLLVCAALNLRSTQPALSWSMWIRLATVFLPLCLFFNPELQKRTASRQLFAVLPWAMFAGALALGVELSLEGPLLKFVRGPTAMLFQYNRGFSYLVVLAFPVMAGLWISKRRWFLAAFVLILFVPASLTESRAAKLALVLGLLTTLAAYILPVVTRRVMMLIPFLAIGWPLAAQKIFLFHHDLIERLPHSWQDRMEIWDYMSYRIFERPLLGWGLGSSPVLPMADPHGALYQVTLTPAPHPHNAVIQLWVELGLPGLAVGILFALFVLRRAGRFEPAIAPFAAGAWMAAFCLSMIAYNFWTDSLWAAFALTGFAFALLQKQTGAQNS